MSKKSLSKVIRKAHSTRDFLGAMATALNADDRTAAIVAGALVELALERALMARFRPLSKTEQDALFTGTNPLSTFSAKIRVAYALGIIGPETRRDLEVIKDVRNAFAHTLHNITFRNRAINRRCASMHIVQRRRTGPRAQTNVRDEFMAATRVLWLLLDVMKPTGIEIEPGLGELAL